MLYSAAWTGVPRRFGFTSEIGSVGSGESAAGMVRMVEQLREKLVFLIEQGVFRGSRDPRLKRDVAAALFQAEEPAAVRSAQSRLSDYLNEKRYLERGETLPEKHHPRLADLFGFSLDWPEWRAGALEAFAVRYQRHHQAPPPREDAFGPEARAGMRAALEAWWAYLGGTIALLPNRLSGALSRRFDCALALLDKDQITEADILDLLTLEKCLNQSKIGYEPSQAAATTREMVDLLRRLAEQRAIVGEETPLDADMERLLELALEEADAKREDKLTPSAVQERLTSFADYAAACLHCQTVRLGLIIQHASCIEGAGRDILAAGVSALRLLVGRRLDLAPDFSIFREPIGGGAAGPDMVVIPAGVFLIGSPEDEPDRDGDEGPQHEVHVRRFAMARFAATFEEFGAYCDAEARAWPKDQGWGRGRRPVILVSCEEAEAYAAWLTERSGGAYRLPSEAEWEYGCRAGTTTPFNTGGEISKDQANFSGEQTVEVDHVGFAPNGFRLWQMHGNVYELCADT